MKSKICSILAFVFLLAQLVSGCDQAEKIVSRLQISCRFSPAIVFNHDIYLLNTCGKNLSEVRLNIKIVGDDAQPTVNRYWSQWSLGEEKDITIPLSEVKNVQRIEITGDANEGHFDSNFRTAN